MVANYQKGFTLLELLVVIFIVIFLSMIAYGSMWRDIRNSDVKNAVAQLTTDLNMARSISQQKSQDASLTFNSNSNYTLKIPGMPAITKNLPAGVIATIYTTNADPSGTTVIYTAPYAEINSNTAFTITQQQAGFLKLRLGLAGLTGTVVTNAID